MVLAHELHSPCWRIKPKEPGVARNPGLWKRNEASAVTRCFFHQSDGFFHRTFKIQIHRRSLHAGNLDSLFHGVLLFVVVCNDDTAAPSLISRTRRKRYLDVEETEYHLHCFAGYIRHATSQMRPYLCITSIQTMSAVMSECLTGKSRFATPSYHWNADRTKRTASQVVW
ncbi:hypothetical protein D3C76_1179060 [compost metagenome]